jgi:LPXTG-site transpeptidase (sortase) family protein
MYPRGTIYTSNQHIYHGSKMLRASLKVRALFYLLRGIGAGLLGFVVIALLISFWPIISAEFSYSVNTNMIDTRPAPVIALDKPTPIDVAAQEKAESIAQAQAEAESLGVDPHFSIVVPKIDAKAKIIANVNTHDEEEYSQALKLGVAHAQGTYFPGQGKTIFLFSHSTNAAFNVERYFAIFYLLNKMEAGDKVVIFFADKKYEYTVTERKVVAASDVQWMNKDFGEEVLILQTCTPPGTSWQRLLVFAKLSK